MQKLDLTTPDLIQENIAKIAALFPNVVTEIKSADGNVKKAIDFDALRQELSGSIVEGQQERYQLSWPGKRQAMLAANAPINKTLRPVRAESVNFDITKNLFIEGDNLDALKLLQETYLGKVKMIYIDPPYNTGKDFIYKDNFTVDKDEYLERSGQRDEQGGRLVANPESNGRYHSDWLSMMYPRVQRARNLLRDDGIIFISIGDDEIHNLRRVCDEIFGRENFCAQFIWNTEGNTDNQYNIKVDHEYIVSYYKDANFGDKAIGHVIDPNTPLESNLWKGYADNNINKNNPENPPEILELPAGFPSHVESLIYKAKEVDTQFFDITRREKFISEVIQLKYGIEKKSGLPVKLDDMVVEDFKLVKPCRIYVGMANRNKLKEFIDNGCKEIYEDGMPMEFYLNSNAAVRYRKKNENPRNILSVLTNFGTTEKTKTYLRRMGIFYDYPKPVGLISYLVNIGCENDGIILDFFAGSGTIAEAIFEASLKNGSQKQFIAVQLPTALDPSKKEQKAAYDFCVSEGVDPVLTEISKERIRRVGAKILGEKPDQMGKLDVGFRVLKIDSSNMAEVFKPPEQVRQEDLLRQVSNIKSDRSAEDLLFQVLLDWGVDITLPIARESIESKAVFFVDGNVLAACFETGISEVLVKRLAARKPLRVVFRDEGFDSDDTKINVEQWFKQLSPDTEVKVI